MKHPWLAAYPPGVPAEIDPTSSPSLVALLASVCEQYGPRRAFGSFGSYLSYAALDRHATAFAAYLQRRMHVHPGDRVAIMLPNLLQYPIALLAILRCGATVVNVNPLYTPRELRHQLVDSGARVILIYGPMLPTLAEIAADTALRAVITTNAGDLFPAARRMAANFATTRRLRRPRLSRQVPFLQALARGRTLRFSPPAIAATDLAFLQYTGGTTGLAKGAMLSHGNMVANVLQAHAWTRNVARPGEEIIITALPLYHIFALTLNCFTFMLHGGLNYLIANPRNLPQFLRELKRVPFTALTGVNTLFGALVQQPEFRAMDFSRLRFVGGGGSAIQRPVAQRWLDVTGTTIVEGFGLTEASPLVCMNPPGLAGFNGSIGVPAPSTECRVVDDDGRTLPPGEAGELWVRGPQIMQGYWQRPEETAQVLTTDGWLRTGDIAVMQPDGFFRIVDRKKDMILVSGFNVYPNEIEEVAAMHAGVAESAAIGVPDARTGEAVRLVVVRSDPLLTEASLLHHCRENLTNYKIPRQIVFVDELPKSNVGKILRREVRARYGEPALP